MLSVEVTKEDTPDGTRLQPVVEQASSRAKVASAMGDGAYDSRSNQRYLHDKGIEPVIKVRKNSSHHAMGCMPRKFVVEEQQSDYDRWRKRDGYGKRWIAESAISSFKRAFGEHVAAVKWVYGRRAPQGLGVQHVPFGKGVGSERRNRFERRVRQITELSNRANY